MRDKLFIHCTFVSNSRVCHHRYYNHVYFWGYHCFSSDWISSTAHASGSRHILRTLFFRALRAPGLWLQRITTQSPDDEMVDVAITALKNAFGDQYEEMIGKEYTAEAIG